MRILFYAILPLLLIPSALGAYEIAYDDGVAEGHYTWEGYSISYDLYGCFATRMTASGYPCQLDAVRFGFTREAYSDGDTYWHFVVLVDDNGNPDESDVIYESAEIATVGMNIPLWPDVQWYQFILPGAKGVTVDGDFWVVCHGSWYGQVNGWFIAADETGGGEGRDLTKTFSGWMATGEVYGWDGGDLFIRAEVDAPITVKSGSLGVIKALFR